MTLLIRVFLVVAGIFAAFVIAPDAPLFGIVQGMLALGLITASVGTLALLEVCIHPSKAQTTRAGPHSGRYRSALWNWGSTAKDS